MPRTPVLQTEVLSSGSDEAASPGQKLSAAAPSPASSIKSSLHHHKQSKVTATKIRQSVAFPLKPTISGGFKAATTKGREKSVEASNNQRVLTADVQAHLACALLLYGPDLQTGGGNCGHLFSLILYKYLHNTLDFTFWLTKPQMFTI